MRGHPTILATVAVAVAVTVSIAVLAAAGCGTGGPASPATVADAWAVLVGDGASAAVYATITTTSADELAGADVGSDVARRVEIVNPDDESDEPGHLGHLDPGGSLNDHAHTVELPADTPVALEPGGAYLALDLLAADLAHGDTFEITLVFDDSPDVTAEVTLRSSAP